MAEEEQQQSLVSFDPNELTLGDVMDLEDVAGKPLSQIMEGFQEDPPSFSARELAALVWIAQRRTNPKMKFEDVRDVKFMDAPESGLAVPKEGATTG